MNINMPGIINFVAAPHSTAAKLANKLEAKYIDGMYYMEWWRFMYFAKLLEMSGLITGVYESYLELNKSLSAAVASPEVSINTEFKNILKPWQLDSLEFLLARWQARGIAQRGAMIHLDMGLGKTLTILSFLHELMLRRSVHVALVVAPAYLLHNWYNEIDKWWQDNVEANIILTKGRKTDITLARNMPNIILVSYTSLGAYTNKINKNIDVLVLDESHKIKNPKAAQTQNALWWDSDFTIISTGTLFNNYPDEIWSQYYRVIKGTRWYYNSFMKYYDWMYRYCYVRPNYFGGISIEGYNSRYLWELQARLSPLHLRITKEQVLGLEQPYIITHKVNTSVDIPENDVQVILNYVENGKKMPTHLTQWLRRMALEKIPYIKNMVKDLVEQHEKVLIFTWHNEVTSVLEKELKKHVKVCTLYASYSKKKRWQIIEQYKKGECDVLIGSIGVLGEGLNLPEVTHIVFAQLPMTDSAFRQAIDRARRIKKDGTFNQPTVHVIIGENDVTKVEWAIWHLIKKKSKVFDAVFS